MTDSERLTEPLTPEELDELRPTLSADMEIPGTFGTGPAILATIDALTTRLAAAEEQYERLATDTFDMIAAEAERAIRAESRATTLATENQAMRRSLEHYERIGGMVWCNGRDEVLPPVHASYLTAGDDCQSLHFPVFLNATVEDPGSECRCQFYFAYHGWHSADCPLASLPPVADERTEP